MRIKFILLFSIFLAFGWAACSQADLLILQKKTRIKQSDGSFKEKLTDEKWEPDRTALIIIDMWDKHWCPTATRRTQELSVFMNDVIKSARQKGIFIIHSPSDVADFYKGHPARIRAIEAKGPDSLPIGIGDWCAVGPLTRHIDYPIDQSDGGCECKDCSEYNAWSQQNPAIEIFDEDAISDSGEEVWRLLEEEKISNVLVAGVAANMCILGRPFGLRNLAKNGKNVVFIRDLTDTMYNPESYPYVDHFTGTDLVVEFIEKYISPTVSSKFLTDNEPFRFAQDSRGRSDN